MRSLLVFVGALLLVHIALLFVHPVPHPCPWRAATGSTLASCSTSAAAATSRSTTAPTAAASAPSTSSACASTSSSRAKAPTARPGLRLLAAEHMDLVIGVGFIFTDDLTTLAKEYPEHALRRRRLRARDSTPPATSCRRRRISPRSSSARSRARSSSARSPRSSANRRRSASSAAWTFPLIHKFEAGYRAGVKYVCPDCTVIAQYAGVTPEAFRNPGRGKELALSQYQSGVNVIFHASGSTGLGVFEAARADRQARDRRRCGSVRRGARASCSHQW